MSESETSSGFIKPERPVHVHESECNLFRSNSPPLAASHQISDFTPLQPKGGRVLGKPNRGSFGPECKDIFPSSTRTVDTQEDDHLCERCRRVDFRTIFDINSETVPETGVPFLQLDILMGEMRVAICPMCRLCAAMLDRAEGGKMLRAIDGKAYDATNHDLLPPEALMQNTGDGRPSRSRKCCLRVVHRTRFNALYRSMALADSPIVVGLGTEETSLHITLHHGMLVFKENPAFPESPGITNAKISSQIPYQNLSTMIQQCRILHKQCRSNHIKYPDGAKVIDCTTRTIVKLTSNMPYLALSYVWGKDRTSPNVDVGDKLPLALPKTIEDAICVCVNLGFHFLWIDRYCIKQYRSSDKMRQISQMANIYSRASATICAIGEDDEAGIMGVTTPRYTECSVKVQGGTLYSCGHDIPLDLRRSVWNQRAWTLQEAMLSPMCLLFSDSGVLVTCNEQVSLEDPPSRCPSFRVPNLISREMLFFASAGNRRLGTPSTTTRFELLQSHYLQRQLGDENDSLNAFRAILVQLDTPSYWGVVTLPAGFEDVGLSAIRTRFMAGLCWQVGSTGRRRKWNEGPTWSWLSRTNQMRRRRGYGEHDQEFYGPVLFLADIEVVHLDSTSSELGDFFRMHEAHPVIPEQTKFLQISSVMVEWKRQEYGPRDRIITLSASSATGLRNFIQECRAKIVFDDGVGYDPSKEDEMIYLGEARDECDYPESGYAVLLMIQVLKTDLVVSRLIAVSKLSDGTYERKGMITTSSPLRWRHDITDVLPCEKPDVIMLG